MKPRLAILFCLALVLVAFFCVIFQSRGQAFTPRRPFIGRPIAGEPNTNIIYAITNMYRWWVASDVPIGQSVSNQWHDRVVGAVMGQANSTYMSLSTSNGIWFNGTYYLTNDILDVGAAGSVPVFLFVLQKTNPAVGNPGALWFGPLISGQPEGFDIDNKMQFHDGTFGNKTGNTPFPTNLLDVIMREQDFYTNGILNKLNSANNLGSGAKISFLGTDQTGAAGTYKFRGYIQELIIWTNTSLTTNVFTSTTLSNLHFYVTNKYPQITP